MGLCAVVIHHLSHVDHHLLSLFLDVESLTILHLQIEIFEVLVKTEKNQKELEDNYIIHSPDYQAISLQMMLDAEIIDPGQPAGCHLVLITEDLTANVMA